MDQLGVEFISVLGMPPAPFVELVSGLGLGHLSLGLHPLDANPHGYPRYSLRDPVLQRELKAALHDRGVRLSLMEGFFVLPGRDAGALAGELDLAAELGAPRINTLGLDADRPRCFDQFAALAEMAAARGLQTTLEFVVGAPVGQLATAVEAVRHVGRSDFKLVLDTMHLGRSGATPAEVAALDPTIVGYAQLCDCPLAPRPGVEEAKYERLPPGEGELPLPGYLQALPPGLVIGLEVPQLGLAQAGATPEARLGHCVELARAMLG